MTSAIETTASSEFSLAGRPRNRGTLESAVDVYGRSLARLTVSRHQEALQLNQDTAEIFLSETVFPSFDVFWSPALGHCFDSLNQHSAAHAAAGLGQHILNGSRHWADRHWELQLPEPCSYYFEGRLLTFERFLNFSELQERINSPYSRKPWTSSEDSGLPVVLGNDDVRDLRLPVPDVPLIENALPEFPAELKECLTLLSRHLPQWAEWIQTAVRFVYFVQGGRQRIHSGSFDRYFGLIYISAGADPLSLAEMLVHEASHQYFHLFSKLDSVSEDEEELHYSPFARRMRPLSKLLLSYHAFANVELFYRRCLEIGWGTPRCRDGIAALESDLNALEGVLGAPGRLTAVGAGFFEPLRRARGTGSID